METISDNYYLVLEVAKFLSSTQITALCQTNKIFSHYCRKPGFWLDLINYKYGLRITLTNNSNSPKEYFVLLESLDWDTSNLEAYQLQRFTYFKQRELDHISKGQPIRYYYVHASYYEDYLWGNIREYCSTFLYLIGKFIAATSIDGAILKMHMYLNYALDDFGPFFDPSREMKYIYNAHLDRLPGKEVCPGLNYVDHVEIISTDDSNVEEITGKELIPMIGNLKLPENRPIDNRYDYDPYIPEVEEMIYDDDNSIRYYYIYSRQNDNNLKGYYFEANSKRQALVRILGWLDQSDRQPLITKLRNRESFLLSYSYIEFI